MTNVFKNNNSARLPSWSASCQRRHLREGARITFDDINTPSVVATTENQGNLGDPATLAEDLHGPYSSWSARYRRINLVWDQLELINSCAELDAVDDLPQRARNRACRVLIWACSGLFQVRETHVCDRFGASTCAEELDVKEIQLFLVDLDEMM